MTRETAIITGGAVRVGRAIALALAKKGYDIALHYNHSEKAAKETIEAIAALGVRATLHQAELHDSHAIAPLIDDICAAHARPSVLINNASIFERESFTETSIEMLESHWRINMMAPFLLSQAFAARCKQGVIVNMLDRYIDRYTGTYFAYLLSKKSLRDLTEMSALELGPDIRVNGVALSIVLPSGELEADYMQQQAALAPLKALPSLEQVTDTVYQLIENDALTGQILYCDAGLRLT